MKGFEMGHPRPPEVRQAIAEGNEKALIAMAKAGGKKAGQLSNQRAQMRDFLKGEEADRQKQFFMDAQAHAEENRIGWDDDFKQ